METISSKSEILKNLKELKQKGVRVIMHSSFMQKNILLTQTINGSRFVVMNGVINGYESEVKVRILKNADEIEINIYLNSSEEDITNQISAVKEHLVVIERDAKTTAIVDFLKEELV